MHQNTPDQPGFESRVLLWIGGTVAFTVVEAVGWLVLQSLELTRALEIFMFGSIALLATISIFAPVEWLRHPAIAGPAADRVILVRAICVMGSCLMWTATVMMFLRG